MELEKQNNQTELSLTSMDDIEDVIRMLEEGKVKSFTGALIALGLKKGDEPCEAKQQ